MFIWDKSVGVHSVYNTIKVPGGIGWQIFSVQMNSEWLGSLTVRFSALQISRQWMNDLYVEKIYSHFRFPAMLRHAIIIIITRWILKRLRRLQQNSVSCCPQNFLFERHTTKTKRTSFFTKFAREIVKNLKIIELILFLWKKYVRIYVFIM